MTLKFDVEWLDGRGVADEAEAATWGRILVRLGETVVSELRDEADPGRPTRAGFYGSTLPLVEWMVDVWPRLFHERRTCSGPSEAWYEWVGFHHLRTARHGGALPDLRFVRRSDTEVFVEAVPDEAPLAPGVGVRFTGHAAARVDLLSLERELSRLVEASLGRLDGVTTDRVARVRKLWTTRRADAVAVAAARLGLDPDGLNATDRAALDGLVREADAELLVGIAEFSTADSLVHRVDEARRLLGEVPPGDATSKAWLALGDGLRARSKPWMVGWEAASAFRSAIAVSDDEVPGESLDVFLERTVGWPRQSQVHRLATTSGPIESVMVRRTGQTPVVATRLRRPDAVRFRLARALYYFAFSRSGSSGTALAESVVPCLERSEASAFAAELLAPAGALCRRRPTLGAWDADLLDDIATEFGVSRFVLEHQIENRHLGEILR